MSHRNKHLHSVIKFRSLLSFLMALTVVILLSANSEAETYQLTLDSPIGQTLAKLPGNNWVKLNRNSFKEVWTPLAQRPAPPEAPSVGDPSRVLKAWSSMAWDPNRGDLIFWGGGHANYPGNEVYRWRASTLEWERASLPSEVKYVGPMNGHYEPVDGMMNAPISAHTYDNSEFLSIVDRFVTFGGAVFNGGGIFSFADGTITGPYFWDPSKANPNQVGGTTGSQVNPSLYSDVTGGQMWQNRNNLKPTSPTDVRPPGLNFIEGATGYAQENGKDVLYIQETNSLFKYTVIDVNDPTKDTYEKVGRSSTTFSGQGAGAYNPDLNIFLRTVSGGIFTYWRLDSPGPLNGNVIFTPAVSGGSFDFSKLGGYGMDYDPLRKVYVLWNGDPLIWILTPPSDLATGKWVLSPVTSTSQDAPDKSTFTDILTGILGKWKYIRALDCYIGVYDYYTGDIWAYKPLNWQPQPADNHPPFITSPANGDYALAGTDLTLTADTIDADKSISKVEFYQGSTKLGESASEPFTFTWTNVPAGVYTLTAVATDNGNITTSQPVSITVSTTDPSVRTVTLQEGVNGYIGTKDTYLDQYYSNSNFGDRPSLVDNSTGWKANGMVHFAIFQSEGGPIPDGAVIESSMLRLYKYSSYDHVYRAYQLLQSWVENETTWNRRAVGVPWYSAGALAEGIDIAENFDGEGKVGYDPQWLSIDVTGGVTKISRGSANNYGWKIVPVSGNSNPKRFYSHECTDPAFRPALTVQYRVVNTGNISPVAVITAPVSGAVVNLGETVSITANAADNDGSVSLVEFYQGATKLGQSTTAPHTLSWTPQSAGVYSLTVIATDDKNASSTSRAVTVTVLDPNSAPAVTLTSPSEGSVFIAGEAITIEAEAFDSDGAVAKVEFYQGSTKLGESTSAPYSFRWEVSQAGNYALTAIATDNKGAISPSKPVNIVVSEADSTTLTAILRDGVNGYAGTRDAFVYEYQKDANFGKWTSLIDNATTWRYASMVRFAIFQSEGGPVPDGAVIESATLSLYKSSSYNYTYRAYPLLRDWKETEVTWNSSAAGIPWSSGGGAGLGSDIATTFDGVGSVGWEPQWLNIDVTAGVMGVSTGSVPNYGWKIVPVSGNSNIKKFFSREYTADPSLRPTLTIKYSEGTVGGNVLPIATITAPAAGTSITIGDTVTVAVDATDRDGAITRVEFFSDSTKLGEITSAPYMFAWTPASVGTFSLTAIATDTGNATVTTRPVVITVNNVNAAPTVAITNPAEGTMFVAGEEVTVTADAADTDGTVTTVGFYLSGAKLGETSKFPFAFTFIAPQAGIYTLAAVATDNSGAATTSVPITIGVSENSSSTITAILRDGLNGYDGTRDAYLYEYQKDSNFGKASNLLDNATTWKYTSLVRFAIFQSEGGPVPDGAVIESATLSLHKYSAYNYTYRAYQLLRDWNETEVTWNRFAAGMPWSSGGASASGSDIAAGFDGEGTVGWDPQWLKIDVTSGVQAMVAGTTPNFGWKVVPVSGNNNMKKFYSRENIVDTSLRPTLTVKYH